MPSPHQAILPFPRQAPPRVRSCRRPFTPAQAPGPYRLPQAVLDRLAPALEPFRNRDAAFALAVFLGRFWSAPKRLGLPFPIDRRALADHAALDLTEARVRGAIRTLEAVGFLDRAECRRLYQATADGLHRRPILYAFGLDAVTAFEAANRRARAAAERAAGGRREPAGTSAPTPALRPSCDPQMGQQPSSPKDTASPGRGVVMGDLARISPRGRVAPPIEPGSALDRALAQLAAGILGKGRA